MESNTTGKNTINKSGPSHPLRIVQVAPDYYPIPPLNYGGIERVVYTLTEELVKLGHDVYLYAPKGSQCSAKIINYQHTIPNPESIADFVQNTLPDNVDIIHDHTHASIVGLKKLPIPTICTIHACRNNPVDYPVYLSKRTLEVAGKNHGFFVYNGINLNEYEFSDTKDDYLLFLGVLDWHKGIKESIEVAEKTNNKLIIAGPIFNYEYYNKEIAPRIKNNPKLQYIGEVGGQQKQDLFKKAKCFLFTTCCEEPFGLVMIEAMACGTPVLAFRNGAVPEVMKGFPDLTCSSVDEMILKLNMNQFPKAKLLREYVEKNFSSTAMAEEYLKLYNKILTEEVNYNYGDKLQERGNFIEAIKYYEQFLSSADLSKIHKIEICNKITDIYFNLKDLEKERKFIFKSFEYGPPRAEFCCKLGYQFLRNNELDKAIFWFELATKLEKSKEILYESCWTWLPFIQLCVCYYRTGDLKKSYENNELALKLNPNNEMIINNKKFLEGILKK